MFSITSCVSAEGSARRVCILILCIAPIHARHLRRYRRDVTCCCFVLCRTFPLASTECPRDWLLQLLLVLHGWVADGQVQQLTCQQEALQHRQLVISGHKVSWGGGLMVYPSGDRYQ